MEELTAKYSVMAADVYQLLWQRGNIELHGSIDDFFTFHVYDRKSRTYLERDLSFEDMYVAKDYVAAKY